MRRVNVSIIICTRNRAENLRHTLRSIAACVVPSDVTAELLVIDNGSTDHTRQVVSEAEANDLPIRYILEPTPGLSHARNSALAHAMGEVILFTDDDVRVPPQWIEGMCRPILADEAEATTGEIALAPHLLRDWLSSAHRAHLLEIKDLSEQHAREPFLIGANMAFSRRVLARVPEFDTNLGAGACGFMEETLFYLQLVEAGYRLKFVSALPVEHHCDASRLTRTAQLKSARAHGESAAYVMHHWEHEGVERRHWKMLGNALRIAKCRWQWMTGAKVGFNPAEVTYVERFWTYWELGRLAGKDRLYHRKALRRTSFARPASVAPSCHLPNIINEH